MEKQTQFTELSIEDQLKEAIRERDYWKHAWEAADKGYNRLIRADKIYQEQISNLEKKLNRISKGDQLVDVLLNLIADIRSKSNDTRYATAIKAAEQALGIAPFNGKEFRQNIKKII